MAGPAIAPKALRFDYQSLGATTGLTDVKANVYVAGVAKAVGASALACSELDSANSKGVYTLVLTSAQLVSFGIAAGGENTVEVTFNSATKPYPTPIKGVAQYATADDVIAYIGSPSTGTIAGDILQTYNRLGAPSGASVSADIAGLITSNATLLSQLTALTNAAQSGSGIAAALPPFLTGSAANTYLIPFTILNSDGALVNATGNVVVGLKNQAGADRGSYLTGSSGSPAVVNATAVSTGQYTITVVVPANAPEEELIFSVNYTVNGNATVKYYVCQLTLDEANSGFALQTTLLSVQTTVNTINTAVGNATYGLSALQAILSNATSGLPALYSYLSSGTTGVPAVLSLLNNGTYGLAALGSALTSLTTNVAAINAQNIATQGAGFVSANNSLVAISQAIAAIPIIGGRAV